MKEKDGKLIVFSAPSASGKTTIVNELIKHPELNLAFSVSATSRPKRPNEIHGKHYYFISPEEFRRKIDENAFVEWEEVYPGHFYGTLKSEVQRLLKKGKNVIFDIDVKGGINVKRMFPQKTLSIFVAVPSMEELEKRLRHRNTEPEEKIQMRLQKAREETDFSPYFDRILMNDQLNKSIETAYEIVKNFIEQE